MKIVIILMERMRTNEDVLHLGHSGSAGRPRGTVCLHTTTGETGGGLRPARGNTHYLQEHTHNSNTRARVSQPLLIWFKHNYIHGALLFHFNPSSTCLHFLNFSNTFSPSSQSLTQTYKDLANFPIVSSQGHFLQILSIPLLHCFNLLAGCSWRSTRRTQLLVVRGREKWKF